MLVSRLILVAVLALSGMAGFLESKLLAQPLTAPVNVVPDCLIFYDFAADASSASFDNRFIGCKTWYVAYTSTGFPALTLTLEDAPDNSGLPGAFVAFAGTLIEGVNPNVAVTNASTIMYGYYPWVRVTLTGSVAGAGRRLRGTFYGYRQTPVATVILPPAVTVTANQGAPNTDPNRWPFYLSDGVNPQGTATNPLSSSSYLWDGINWVVQPACNSRAPITIAGAGTIQLVGGQAALKIRVCHVSMSFSGATDVTLVEGTGINCAGTPANITGAYTNILGLALDLGDRNLVSSTPAFSICATVSAAVTGGGFIVYTKSN